MASEISFTADGNGRIRVDGRLTFETVDARLLERSRSHLQGKGNLVVDLAGVEEGDSAGLALLIEWRCWAHQTGVQLEFANVPSSLLGIADISDVSALLGLAPAQPAHAPASAATD